MRLKHDGTFFLTSTWQRHCWKRVRGERNVSYWRLSFFVIHRQIASQQRIGDSWKLILRKAQQTAREDSIRKRREMVVKIVMPFLRWGYSSSGGFVYLILILLMKILTVITKLIRWDVNSWRREGWKLFSQWLDLETFSTKSEFYSICSCVQLQPYITWHNTPILLAHVSSQTIHFNWWGSFSWIKIYRGFAKFS